ncbi:sigma-54-dependent transcriptional regulator [Brevirhabdus sp.]|uniref:sigma-54-dependent transcriptional regulator n=1 Tax=Brevirhabdus sp. TaxID=2004514 RepID=UPI0040580448
MKRSVVLVSTDRALAASCEQALGQDGLSFASLPTGAGMAERITEIAPAAVLLDLNTLRFEALSLMRKLRLNGVSAPVIALIPDDAVDRAVILMKEGAYDYLIVPFEPYRLERMVLTALEADAIRTPGAQDAAKGLDFTGTSPAMLAVYHKIHSVSRSMATVFITGESGTGKTRCARQIHLASARADKPFVAINCAAVTSDTLASEVFGHVKGAFPGAVSDRTGTATAADGGTLFLNNLSDLDGSAQAQMLRFLQDGIVHPLGAAESHKVNIRVICASNTDPTEDLRQGTLRPDLFYLLNIVPIHIPPLRDRKEDVPALAERFLADCNQDENKSFERIDLEVEDLFRRYAWPGNVRELKNVLRQVCVLYDFHTVRLDMLPDRLRVTDTSLWRRRADDGDGGPSGMIGRTLAEIESWVIEETIRQCNGSIPKAARILAVAPSTIYRKRGRG